MKHVLLVICASASLAGCANWSHGSWLDTYGVAPRVAPAIEASHAATLRAEIARLQAEGESLRLKLATEPDRIRRVAYRRQLRANYDQLQPLEHELRHGPDRRPKWRTLFGAWS